MACAMCGSKGGTLHDGGCGVCGAGRFYNDAAEQIDAAVAEALAADRARIAAAIREELDNTSEWVVESVLARLLHVVEGG